MRKKLHMKSVWVFVVASTLGVLIALPLVGAVGSKGWTMVIALYLIWSGFFPSQLNALRRHVPNALAFFVSGAAALVFGTGGKVYAPFVMQMFDEREVRIAMLSFFAAIQHLVKLPIMLTVFQLNMDLMPLIVAMCAAALLGNWVGGHILLQLTDKVHARLQAWSLVVVGGVLLIKSAELPWF